MKIKNVKVREIFDSRAASTLEVVLEDQAGREFSAQVPSGKSRGSNEAAVFGFLKARAVLRRILARLKARQFKAAGEFDKFLLGLDGTVNKSNLGGNLTLGLSVTMARAFANQSGLELWRFLQKEFFQGQGTTHKPVIFSNLINGGTHARNTLDIQEYMVVLKPGRDLARSLKLLIGFYEDLGEDLRKKFGLTKLAIGDESGYSIDFADNHAPIKLLETLLYQKRLHKDFGLALDAAASSFYHKGEYRFDKKLRGTADMANIYARYFRASRLLMSIEDPFFEEDREGFGLLMQKLKSGILVVGDDLTTTNQTRIKECADEHLINAVIIKPNQIGTLGETAAAIIAAKRYGVKTIISHRSGETEDNLIIHIAKASGAYGLKIGAPLRERIYKFNEVLRVFGAPA